jgi:DNA-binding MurR/RpiR family transcriptional regulator
MNRARAVSSYDDLRARIVESRDSMPKRLAQLAGFVLANPDDVALGTAASIASAADAQPSTLVRLAHYLGYGGFSEFQLVFRDQLKSRASTYDERLDRLHHGGTPETQEAALLHGFLNAARHSIDGLANTINLTDFGQAVHLLAPAGTIYLIARRRSFSLTAQMSYMFAKLGIRAVMVNSSMGIEDDIIRQATTTDAAIACSFSPYAPETVQLAKALAERNVPVVAITDSAMSPICKLSRVWLEVAESDHAGFRSIAASMALATALPVAIGERRRHGRPDGL